MKLKTAILAAAIGLAGSFGAHAADKDIVDTAVGAGQFKTLAAALEAADLVSTLKGAGPFTVFAPTDEAFARLPAGTVEDLLKPENKDELAAILTYHVVPGATIKSKQAAASDGARLTTAQGKKVKVSVRTNNIFLVDKDYDDRNPRLITRLLDVNKGNKQIAHGIHRVLRPIDL